jgi:hypothetical protein
MDLFLPIEERRQILRDTGEVFKLRTFVETGTNNGLTVQFLIPYFDELYTVELDWDLAQNARRMFEGEPKVHPFAGDSAVWLHNMVTKLDAPALFWLDGHYSGPGTARGPVSTPIRVELEAVFKAPKGSVVLIDDARCFGGGAEHDLYEHYSEYPSIDWVREQAEFNDFKFLLEKDIMFLIP